VRGFIAVLTLWFISSPIIKEYNSDQILSMEYILEYALPLSFMYIIIRIIIDNSRDISRIFKRLALIPLVIVGTHLFLM